jgi:hypothetical protein
MDNYFILSSKYGDKWAQGSSQHDKCQVGNMHAYSLELIHFPIIPSSFTHSFIFTLYLLVTIIVSVPWLDGSWIEETGCQAYRILKRQGFQSNENSLHVRELMGIDS